MNALVRILYLIRGVPGSGKTTYAKTLGIADHYEADMWFDANGGYDQAKIKQAHEWCQRMATQAMESGRPCVVANTFTRLWEMEYYKAVAKRLGYEVREVVMRGEWPNVHGVPDAKVRQMRDRFEYANEKLSGGEAVRSDALFGVSVVTSDGYRSQPYVNTDEDMVRVVLDMPKHTWRKLQKQLPPNARLDRQEEAHISEVDAIIDSPNRTRNRQSRKARKAERYDDAR